MTPTLEDSVTTLKKIISLEATQKVAVITQDYQYTVFTDHHDTKTLEFIKLSGEPAAITVQRHSDGTFTRHTQMEPEDDLLYHSPDNDAMEHHRIKHHVTATLRTMILREALLLAGPILPQALADQSVNQELDYKASYLMNSIMARNTMPAWLSTQHQQSRPNEQIVSKFMAEPDVQILLSHFYQHDPVTVPRYNNIVRNRRIIKEMEGQDHSDILHLYMEWFAEDTDQTVIRHPGQITQKLRDALGLNDPQWKIFARIPRTAWPDISNYTTEQIAKVCQIFHVANPAMFQNHPTSRLIDVIKRDDTDLSKHWSHGKPINAWANLVRRYTEITGENEIFRTNLPEAQTLSSIADALRGTIENDQPWGPGAWPILVTRSERWHQQLLAQRALEERKAVLARQNARWESSIDEVTLGPYRFRALNTPLELHDLGAKMGNCIGNYEPACMRGTSRIFQVDQEEVRVAAVELVRTNLRWSTGQAEADHRKTPPPDLPDNHQKLCELYNQAFANSPAGEDQP